MVRGVGVAVSGSVVSTLVTRTVSLRSRWRGGNWCLLLVDVEVEGGSPLASG